MEHHIETHVWLLFSIFLSSISTVSLGSGSRVPHSADRVNPRTSVGSTHSNNSNNSNTVGSGEGLAQHLGKRKSPAEKGNTLLWYFCCSLFSVYYLVKYVPTWPWHIDASSYPFCLCHVSHPHHLFLRYLQESLLLLRLLPLLVAPRAAAPAPPSSNVKWSTKRPKMTLRIAVPKECFTVHRLVAVNCTRHLYSLVMGANKITVLGMFCMYKKECVQCYKCLCREGYSGSAVVFFVLFLKGWSIVRWSLCRLSGWKVVKNWYLVWKVRKKLEVCFAIDGRLIL